ncbi:hypothetical protein Y032_0116g572 [Ancylostoma ceylanicum]|uniref:VWFA domain-containing protein n=1 Tax=Ancylostoma ceylanicum TaxID=53326 RepID=A0A016TCI3_9BILA|nr:hypothetical protein Y032_0116g572 [Ancylostoma ceylanicum]
MLEKETSKHKTMIIFNDGDSDICRCTNRPNAWAKCRAGVDCDRGRVLIRQHPQKVEAKKIHDLGIQVVLIAVGPNVLAPGLETYDNAVRIAGGRENMIPAKDFQNFDTNVLQQVLKEFCREVY